MATTEFDIDSYIGEWGYSNRYVKSYLNAAGKNPVICHVCSGGGDFLMAINIKDQFAAHGSVTVDISGYAASAATLIGLGAKHTRISNSSFYLIHKVMSWVDAWGGMNEDQISDLITHLEKVKDENEKMTLVAAKAYADRSGKPVLEILNLMKEEKWLTADEAKEWGFVDEVYNTTTTKINLAKVSEKFNMMGLPKLPDSSASDDDSLVGKVVSGIREFFSKENTTIFPQSKIDQKPMKQFTLLNSILAVTSLESQDGKGAYLNEAQLQAFEDAISGKDNRITELTQHETNYNNAVDKLNALHPDVASAKDLAEKVNVLSRKLAEKPGVPASGQSENPQNQNDGVDWDKMMSLEHMKD